MNQLGYCCDLVDSFGLGSSLGARYVTEGIGSLGLMPIDPITK